MQVNQIGSLFNLHFTDAEVSDYPSVLAGNRQILKNLYTATLDHGVVFGHSTTAVLFSPMTSAELGPIRRRRAQWPG